MSPSADVAQCALCLGRRRLKQDGTFYEHNRGRPGAQKRCPGSGQTVEDSRRQARGLDPLPSEVRPEDIF